jgi:hypothetical protein
VVAGYSDTVRLSSTDGQAVLPSNARLMNGSGIFSLTLRTAGSQSITATDTVAASLTGTAAAIEVSPGPPDHFSVSATTNAQSGKALDFTVTARDAANNVATSYSGTVHFSSSDAQAALPANSTLTDGAGTFPATLQTAGSETLTATDTVNASITGTSSSIDVGAGPATHLAISPPAATQAGVPFYFGVSALDAANNATNSYSGTVHFSSTDTQATLPANSSLTNGMGNFPAALQTVGSQTITATDTVTGSITGTSSSIDVGPMPPPIHFSVSAPATAQSGTTFKFVVTALNIGNDVDAKYTGTVQFSSTDPQAVLPASSTLTNGTGSFSATLQAAGSQTLTVTDTSTASINGTSSAIDVSPGPATHLSVSAPTQVLPGKPFRLIVTARDDANNVASSYPGTVHLTSTEANAALPPDSTLAQGMGVFSASLPTTGTATITATDTVTGSITGTSNPIDVTSFICRTRGESCCVGPSCTQCCPGLRCILIVPIIGAHICEY